MDGRERRINCAGGSYRSRPLRAGLTSGARTALILLNQEVGMKFLEGSGEQNAKGIGACAYEQLPIRRKCTTEAHFLG